MLCITADSIDQIAGLLGLSVSDCDSQILPREALYGLVQEKVSTVVSLQVRGPGQVRYRGIMHAARGERLTADVGNLKTQTVKYQTPVLVESGSI